MITPEQVQKSVKTNTPTKATVSWVRPTNFVDKKTAFASYQKAKASNYAGDFVAFVNWLEQKWYPVENSNMIRQAKANAQFSEQKKKDAQMKLMKKIPISEASVSDIRNDFTKTLWEDFSVAWAPVAWALQWFADIWQGAVWKPVEFLAKKFLWMFWYDDESVESLTTQSDISKWFNKKWANIGREAWKIVWTLPLWWGTMWTTIKWLKWIPYMKEIAKRLAVWASEWLLWWVAYNAATTDTIWTPADLSLTTLIGAGVRWLPIIWNELTPLVSKIPWIKNQLAQKLQLNGLFNQTKLDNLQNILKQWWADELALWRPEDVAEWMFQRWLEGNKPAIITKLDEIAEAAIDMVDVKLNKIKWVYKIDTMDNILEMLGKEYDGAVSKEFQDKFSKVWNYLSKNQKWWLTIAEINDVKRMVYKDLNPYTASWKVKASSADVASASRELKNFIEDIAEQSGVTKDWMTIKLLNNEFAMADALKKAITQKDQLDRVSELWNFISRNWWPMAIGWILGSQWWVFNNDTLWGRLWNIVVWALAGRYLFSTTAKTKIASWLRNIPDTQKAKILNIVEKWVDNATDAEKNAILQSFKTLDVDVNDNAFVDFSTKSSDAIPGNTIGNAIGSVDGVVPSQATQQLDNVASPTASLDELLKNATDEELKANWFTATMIKQWRKKNPLTKASTAESATQSIAGKADEVLQTPSAVSKVDDALPTAWKMWKTAPTAKSLDKIDDALMAEARKYKSADDFLDAISTNLANKDIMTFSEYKKVKPNTTLDLYNNIKEEMPFMLEKEWEVIKWINLEALNEIVAPWNKWWHYQIRKIREEANKAK